MKVFPTQLILATFHLASCPSKGLDTVFNAPVLR